MDTTALKPLRDITGMGAILPVLTPIGRKCPAAMSAATGFARRLIPFVTIPAPPHLPTLNRTELPLLSLWQLHQRLAAKETHSRCRTPCQFVVAAKGLHGIDGYAHQQGNLFISEAISAQHVDLLFLFFRHRKHLLQGSLGRR
jgi:hypothetical protein